MSLKFFHIVFSLSVAGLCVFGAYWNYNQWIYFEKNESLFYTILCVFFMIATILYAKYFIKKSRGVTLI